MKKDMIGQSLLKVLLAVLTFLCLLLIGFIMFSTKAHADSPRPEQATIVHQQQIISAYSDLLHRVWIDKPSYVEDVLVEYDEFISLDELLHGEWGNTFVIRDKNEKQEYCDNWIPDL